MARRRLHPRRLRLELPRRRRAAHRHRLLLACPPRQGADRAASQPTSTCRRRATRATGYPISCAAQSRTSVFFTGDSAGHCLPLTAEGIRTAIYFGLACGRELRAVVERPRHARAGARPLRRLLRLARAQIRLAARACSARSVRSPRAAPRPPSCARSRAGASAHWAFDHYLAIAPPSFVGPLRSPSRREPLSTDRLVAPLRSTRRARGAGSTCRCASRPSCARSTHGQTRSALRAHAQRAAPARAPRGSACPSRGAPNGLPRDVHGASSTRASLRRRLSFPEARSERTYKTPSACAAHTGVGTGVPSRRNVTTSVRLAEQISSSEPVRATCAILRVPAGAVRAASRPSGNAAGRRRARTGCAPGRTCRGDGVRPAAIATLIAP